MSQNLRKEEIEHLAQLSRIGLKTDEVERHQQEISKILRYFNELQSLDTSKVPPFTSFGLKNRVRDDEIKKSEISREEILLNAPSKERGFIKVKSVFKNGNHRS